MLHGLDRSRLAFWVLPILVRSHSPCHCETPTPCLASNGKCIVPVLTNITQCPANTQDCRHSSQTLCEKSQHAEDGFCCWTTCSSLAVLRKCGKEPRGFEFEKTGVRNNTECHDPLNVREKCCLRELHTMKALEPRSSQCPKEGHDLVALFDLVDGNGDNPANAVISPYEAMSSLQILHAKGYRFVAEDFHKMDVNGNHELSWYEFQLFCGHVGEKIPADEINEIKPSNIWSILQNPLYFAALVSTLVLGELIGLLQVVCWHAAGACGFNWRAEEGVIVKTVYVFLAQIWPVVYVAIMWFYYFYKIEWEVCDKDGDIRWHFLYIGLLPTAVKLVNFGQWIKRRCPVRPSVDLERRCFLQQESFRRMGKRVSFLTKGMVSFIAVWSVYRAALYGDLGMEFDNVMLRECKHEDPDLALIFKVNEEFFLWNIFSTSFLALYNLAALPIQHKQYELLPAEEFALPIPFVPKSQAKDKFVQELDDAVTREKMKWAADGYFS